MKQHTIDFKNQLTELGRELRGVITYNNTELEEEIYSITPHYNADLLKSVMKQLDLELSVDIPLNTIINCQIGIKVNEQYEMLNYGNYVVYKSEKQEDTNTYKLTCYDKLLYSMKKNEDLGVEYPIKIKDYLIALGNKIGLSVANTTFYNQDMKIPSELYLGQDYTYRDILDEIAQATGSIICLNENDEIQVKYPTQTNDTIDEEYLKDVNVKFGKRYGAINTIVLSRAGESDNVYYPSPLPQNPVEIKIVDNQIMNFNNRSDFLKGIYNALNGLYYYINDFTSTGILYYDVGDLYNVRIGENTYQCLMLNDEVNVTTGIEEIIHTDMPEKSETDYSKADKTDMRINKTYLIVDKQNQKIKSVVNNVTEQNNKISQITQTVDEINSKIQDIADVTTYGESDKAEVELKDINESEPIMIRVHPTSENISYLYPNNNLLPSDTQYLPDRIIRFRRTYEENGTTKTENIDYLLPDDLLRYSDTVYDEFYLNYESQTCQVIKRCAYNADGTVRALGKEITTDYPYPTIGLGEGNYTITLPGYDFGYVYVRLMAKNIYTTQFYTKGETDSRINQKANEINVGVNQTLTNYSTTNEMNSAIDLKANQITSSVSENYATKSELNSSTSSLNSKIDQTAQSINLTVDSVQEQVETAQSTADTATTKANNAQTSANNAQATADSINTNLTTNYYTKTQTNSAINQKADSITSTVSQTYSTKTETTAAKNAAINSANASTDTKLQSYSTTTQMNTAIEQKANQITSTVSQTYSTKTETSNAIDAIEIGARNYFVGTGTLKNLEVNKASGYGTYDPYSTSENKTLLQLGFNVGDEVTISFNWQIAKNGSLAFVYGNCRLEWVQGSTYLAGIKNPAMTFSAGNTAGYVTATVKLNSTSINANKVRFRIDNSVLILKISNMKVEKGNKATSWTPAPEEYSTTTEMNSAITQTANTIMTSVNQKVGKLEFGTYITQNKDSVKLAWNQISEYIQMMIIQGNASFAVLDKNKKVLMALNKTGQHFYKSDGTTIFGEMGVNKEESNNYISFSVEGEYGQDINNGMAWGIKTSDGKFHPILYLKDFHMGAENADDFFGNLVLQYCDLILSGMESGIQSGNVRMYGNAFNGLTFEDTNSGKTIMSILPEGTYSYGAFNILNSISFYRNVGGSNSFKIGNDNKYVLIQDDGSFHVMGGVILLGDNSNKVSFDVYVQSTANIRGNLNVEGEVYANNISSDRRLKKNITDSTTSALNIINKIQHKEFDKIDDNKHYKIGYIAQELEEIDSNFVIKRPEDKDRNIEERYYINELPIIATLTKAIQEQQEEIEELKKEIEKLKGGK